MRLIRTLVAPRWRPGRAALAGLLATLAYSVAMEGDIYITGNRFNDVRFIEGLLIGRAKPSAPVRLLAWGLHLLNGALLAEIYAAVFKRFLPGPGWLRGSIFASVFITGAWSLTPLADRYHPLIKNGEQPRLANRTAYLQNLFRHLVFGLTLGLLYRE